MKFLSPKGAVRDTKELEFLVALHQTSHDEFENFVDGSIDAKDVRAFLLSRYGIRLTETQVREVIFRGLAGGEGEDEALDILEIVAILMIPMLVKVSDGILGDRNRKLSIGEDEKRLLPPETIIEDVLRDILSDATDGAYDVDHPPSLTPALIKQIFLEYDEFELFRDDTLIQEMIDMATEKDTDEDPLNAENGSNALVLDVKAFAKALTKDTNLYNPENETRYSEVYDDVFPNGIEEQIKKDASLKQAEDFSKSASRPPSLIGETFQKVTTFSHMDYTADNFVHVIHVVMVWLVIVFSYFWYMNGVSNPEFLVDESVDFGRRVGFAVFRWTVTMLKLVIVGSTVGFLLALGNGLFQKTILEPIVGLVSVVVLVFIPFFSKENNFVFNTNVKDSEHSGYYELSTMLLVFGSVLVIVQLKNLVTIIFGKGDRLKNLPAFVFLENILGSNVNRAYRSKQAAIFKINQMARNAYELHELDKMSASLTELKRKVSVETAENPAKHGSSKALGDENVHGGKSSREIALLKYSDLADEREEVGGIVWAWKGYISGNLGITEGVWLPSRLLAANVILFVAIFVVLYICTEIFSDGIRDIDEVFNAVKLKEVIYSEDCFSEFDINDCYFPFEEAGFYSGVAVCRDVSLSGPKCLELFQPVDPASTFGSAVGSICEGFESAFAPFENQVANMLGGASCSYVLDAAKPSSAEVLAPFNYSEYDSEIIYNACYRYTYMSENDIEKFNEWFDDDEKFPDITEDTLEFCEAVANIVSNETFVDAYTGREDEAYAAFQLCMTIYRNLSPQPFCEQELYYPIDEVLSYEKNRTDDTQFCYTYLSICVPDWYETKEDEYFAFSHLTLVTLIPTIENRYNPSRGTCVIGEADNRYYRFEGNTCRDYPSINSTLNHYETFVKPGEETFLSLFPARWMLTLTATIGILSGFIAAFSTAMVYIPSSIHTILKFRTGVIPSLRDPKFLDYRKDLHNQTYMIGGMFWGLILSTAIVTFLSAGVTFILVWPTTRPFVVNIIAQVLGIVITILLKIVLCFLAMRATYAGFYRTKPMFANVFCLALECWNLALTLALVGGRLGKFVVLTSFYVGRIDRPVLADGLFLKVDKLPIMFRQNLLSTESHRHPYVEMLGQMYLMKLRHREHFGSRAGSIWRLLFVSALMPWLKKNRIQDDDVDIDELRGLISKEPSEPKQMEDVDGDLQDKLAPQNKSADSNEEDI